MKFLALDDPGSSINLILTNCEYDEESKILSLVGFLFFRLYDISTISHYEKLIGSVSGKTGQNIARQIK
jgi:hypothetical protein